MWPDVKIIFQYLAFTTMQNLAHTHHKIAKVGSMLPNTDHRH